MKDLNQSLSLCLLFVLLLLNCQKERPSAADATFGELEHPVLLLQKGEEEELRSLFATEPIWEEMHFAILRKCNDFFGQPLLRRNLIGRYRQRIFLTKRLIFRLQSDLAFKVRKGRTEESNNLRLENE
ncbi:MAG: hypothetical protein HRU41_19400 [Saprospiraceae bacterium]|nr:hypothetical protein [Saprospiraceae bacterium]